MPVHVWYILLNHSILFPVVAGIIRFRYAGREYLPFLILIWAGAVNDTLSLILAYTLKTNSLNGNVYVLIEYFLLLYLFWNWNNGRTAWYIIWFALGTGVWVADNFVYHSITDNNSFFRIVHSVITVFFAVDRFNKIVVFEKSQLFKNPQFLICTAFVVYYFCKAFAEIPNACHVPFDNNFFVRLWLGLASINCLSNITYGTAILCIQEKHEFTLHY